MNSIKTSKKAILFTFDCNYNIENDIILSLIY